MKNARNRSGFTLIELLTVIAIIAMLMAIFGVGARKMKIVQRNLQQKAVFHGMEIGLELFSKDFDGYPDSAIVNSSGTVVCGAQRLTEALFGRDERGFHPRSKWHPNLDMTAAAPHPGAALYTETTKNNRKALYMQLKHGGIYTIAELWGSPATSLHLGAGSGTERSAVITDVFAYNIVTIAGQTEKVGMPLLYYKADGTKRFRLDAANQPVTTPTQAQYKDWVYNYDDNLPILQLNWLRELENSVPGLTKHYTENGGNEESFYESLTERKADMDNNGTLDFFKPFNPSTFILISAGYDGIYGTNDDITNFNY